MDELQEFEPRREQAIQHVEMVTVSSAKTENRFLNIESSWLNSLVAHFVTMNKCIMVPKEELATTPIISAFVL